MSWRLDTQKTGLLVIDMQERLMEVVPNRAAVLDRAARMVAFARVLGLPICVTEQNPQRLGPTVQELRNPLGETYFPERKMAFSACECLPKDHRRTMLVVGIETHICVRQTVLDLHDTAVYSYVLADACGSRRQQDHNVALAELRHGDISVSTVESVCFELLGSAEHPKFRDALSVLK